MEESKSFESRVESIDNQTETEKDISNLNNNMNDTENLSELIETEVNESKKTEDIVDSVENEKVTEEVSVEENKLENEKLDESNSDIEKKELESFNEKQEESLQNQKEIAEGQDENAEKQEELTEIQEENAEKQEDFTEIQEENAEKQEDFTEIQEENAEKQEDFTEIQEENAEKQEEQELAKKQNDNNNIQEEINKKQEETSEKQEEINEKQEEINEKQEEINKKQEENYKDEEKESDNAEEDSSEGADKENEQTDAEPEKSNSENLDGDNDVIKVEATDSDKTIISDPSTDEVTVKSKYDRDELIKSYHYAVAERELLATRNATAQHKLAEYFRKRRTDDAAIEAERSLEDQEQRYIKTLSLLSDMEMQMRLDDELIARQVMDLKEQQHKKELEGEREMSRVNERRKSVALRAVFSRSGRRLSVDDVTTMNENDERKSKEVSETRLENVKLKYQVQKLESRLREKELLAEGLHLIDFEQLKIENQTYGEKIEERNEELMKLRKKITDTVQILTHLKEKLNFTQKESDVMKGQLSFVEEKVKTKRDVISRTKRARDSLRVDNRKLVLESGLLGFNDLLQDYGDEYHLREDLRHQVEMLKRRHAELSLNIRSIKKKINVAEDSVAV